MIRRDICHWMTFRWTSLGSRVSLRKAGGSVGRSCLQDEVRMRRDMTTEAAGIWSASNSFRICQHCIYHMHGDLHRPISITAVQYQTLTSVIPGIPPGRGFSPGDVQRRMFAGPHIQHSNVPAWNGGIISNAFVAKSLGLGLSSPLISFPIPISAVMSPRSNLIIWSVSFRKGVFRIVTHSAPLFPG